MSTDAPGTTRPVAALAMIPGVEATVFTESAREELEHLVRLVPSAPGDLAALDTTIPRVHTAGVTVAFTDPAA